MWVEAKCAGLTLTPTLIFFTLSIWVVRDVDCLATKLQGRFPTYGVIDSFGVVYPQYWI
jgi:hypothetical protein